MECVLSMGCVCACLMARTCMWMSRGWIPRGPLKGPVSNVGGKAEVGRPGTHPVVLEGGVMCRSRPVFPVSPFLVIITASKRIILESGDLQFFFFGAQHTALFKSEHVSLFACLLCCSGLVAVHKAYVTWHGFHCKRHGTCHCWVRLVGDHPTDPGSIWIFYFSFYNTTAWHRRAAELKGQNFLPNWVSLTSPRLASKWLPLAGEGRITPLWLFLREQREHNE